MTAVDWTQVGREAFEHGDPAAPALNAQVVEALKGRPVGDPETALIMRAFSAGWTEANLAAPVACPTCDGHGMTNSDGTQPGSPPGPHAEVRKCSSCDGTGSLPV